MGGSVAGGILGGGEGAKNVNGEAETSQSRAVVSVVTPKELVAAVEATLTQLGGQLHHEASEPISEAKE